MTQIHGWPDLALGWRNQISFLAEEYGFRVVCPDLPGFGETDAPQVPPEESLSFYSFKRVADDVRELARRLGCARIVLGGHDWVSEEGTSPHYVTFPSKNRLQEEDGLRWEIRS